MSSLSIYELPSAEATYEAILSNRSAGLQATMVATAREALHRCLAAKKHELGRTAQEQRQQPQQQSASQSATSTSPHTTTRIILSYTSNLVSSGLRELFASMVETGYVDSVISTAGGVEEDIIKCFGQTLVGDFALPGAQLRASGLNRVGNLIIPNDNYASFEDYVMPLLAKLHRGQMASYWGTTGGRSSNNPSNRAEKEQQKEEKCVISPSQILHAMGLALDETEVQPMLYGYNSDDDANDADVQDSGSAITGQQLQQHQQTPSLRERRIAATKRRSLLYQCAKRNIPVYCPALTDGSIGDMMCFYNFKNKGFVVDPSHDEGALVELGPSRSSSPSASSGPEKASKSHNRERAQAPSTSRHEEVLEDTSSEDDAYDELCEPFDVISEDDTHEGKDDVLSETHIVVIALGAGLPRNHTLTHTPPTGTLLRMRGLDNKDNSRSHRVVRIKRTVLQVTTGSAVDACRSSCNRADDVSEGIISPLDEVYGVSGDAALVFPLMMAGCP